MPASSVAPIPLQVWALPASLVCLIFARLDGTAPATETTRDLGRRGSADQGRADAPPGARAHPLPLREPGRPGERAGGVAPPGAEPPQEARSPRSRRGTGHGAPRGRPARRAPPARRRRRERDPRAPRPPARPRRSGPPPPGGPPPPPAGGGPAPAPP